MHLAVTWTKNKGKIYINGYLDAQAVLHEGLPDRPLPKYMQLGAITSWINAGACGVISDFRIYSKALSQKQIWSQMHHILKDVEG